MLLYWECLLSRPMRASWIEIKFAMMLAKECDVEAHAGLVD